MMTHVLSFFFVNFSYGYVNKCMCMFIIGVMSSDELMIAGTEMYQYGD